MTLKKALFLAFIVLGVIAGACARQKDSGEPSVSPSEPPELKETTPSSEEVARIGERRLSEELSSETGAFDELTPELFVRLTILYRSESAQWVVESSSFPDAEQQRYIDEENRRFFDRFGITEEEYIRYSTEHIEELERYLEAHPELISDLKGE